MSVHIDEKEGPEEGSKGDTTQEKYATKEPSIRDSSSVKLKQEILFELETIFQPKFETISTLLEERLHTMEIMLGEKLDEWSHKHLEAVERLGASQLKRGEEAAEAEQSPADRWEAIEVLSPRDIGDIEMFPDQYEKVRDLDYKER